MFDNLEPYGLGDKEDRVIFVLVCEKYNKRKAIYDNKEKYIFKKEYCPKFNTELNKPTKVKDNDYITICKCGKYNYKKFDKLD